MLFKLILYKIRRDRQTKAYCRSLHVSNHVAESCFPSLPRIISSTGSSTLSVEYTLILFSLFLVKRNECSWLKKAIFSCSKL